MQALNKDQISVDILTSVKNAQEQLGYAVNDHGFVQSELMVGEKVGLRRQELTIIKAAYLPEPSFSVVGVAIAEGKRGAQYYCYLRLKNYSAKA